MKAFISYGIAKEKIEKKVEPKPEEVKASPPAPVEAAPVTEAPKQEEEKKKEDEDIAGSDKKEEEEKKPAAVDEPPKASPEAETPGEETAPLKPVEDVKEAAPPAVAPTATVPAEPVIEYEEIEIPGAFDMDMNTLNGEGGHVIKSKILLKLTHLLFCKQFKFLATASVPYGGDNEVLFFSKDSRILPGTVCFPRELEYCIPEWSFRDN